MNILMQRFSKFALCHVQNVRFMQSRKFWRVKKKWSGEWVFVVASTCLEYLASFFSAHVFLFNDWRITLFARGTAVTAERSSRIAAHSCSRCVSLAFCIRTRHNSREISEFHKRRHALAKFALVKKRTSIPSSWIGHWGSCLLRPRHARWSVV